MKNLLEMAKEDARFYADMAVQANVSGKILNVEKDILIQTEPEKPSASEQAKLVRTIRNKKLQESDWTQSNDSPLTEEQRSEWAIYRQKLRDITKQKTFPQKITWP